MRCRRSWRAAGMINVVQLDSSTYAAVPARFEAGTPAIAEAVGLGRRRRLPRSHRHRAHPSVRARAGAAHALARLRRPTQRGRLRPRHSSIAPASSRSRSVTSTRTISRRILDSEGVCVRAGHHCNQPLMEKLGVPATTRASFYIYNTPAEVDTFIAAIDKAKRDLQDRMNDSGMDELYRDFILDHYRNPRNAGTLEAPDASFEDTNPLVRRQDPDGRAQLQDGIVNDVKFAGAAAPFPKRRPRCSPKRSKARRWTRSTGSAKKTCWPTSGSTSRPRV